MRIVHLVNTLEFGGAEQVAATLAAYQSLRGHSVSLVCLRGRGSPSLDSAALADAGVEIVTLEKPEGVHLGTLRRLASILTERDIEVIHTHNHLVHHYGALAGRRAGTPAVLNTLHGSNSLRISAPWTRFLYWLSCLRSDRVVSVGAEVHRLLSGRFHLAAKKLCVVENGIELSRFLRIPPASPNATVTYGQIGRFDPVKDHDNLFRAFAILRRKHPQVRLRLLGDGELKPALQALAESQSIAGEIQFEGFSPDTAGFLGGIDVYVISSKSEGLPLTLLEAMAAARPIVATAVGEIPRILDRARCGWQCPPSDPAQLAGVMEQALLAPDRASVGANGRIEAERNYSVQRMAHDYHSIYRAILHRRKPVTTARTRVKNMALPVLVHAGAYRLGELVHSRRLLVLSYHRVVPRTGQPNGQRPINALFTDEFEAQMAFVAQRFQVPTGDGLRAIIEGTGEIPRYSLAITFDDGYENNFAHALPILERYGLHATFFLTTGLIGQSSQRLWFDRLDRLLAIAPTRVILEWLRRVEPAAPTSFRRIRSYFKSLPSVRQSAILDGLEETYGRPGESPDDRTVHGMLSWDQVRSLAAAGMTIGSHTSNHQILAAIPPEQVGPEVTSSRMRIEQETGQACWCFAYPNGARGDFRPSDQLAVQDAGYACAFTQISGSISSRSPRFMLPRIPVPDSGDLRVFRGHVSGVYRAH